MKRVADYRQNARECIELANKMPEPQRQQLLDMARLWEQIANEREDALETGLEVPDLKR